MDSSSGLVVVLSQLGLEWMPIALHEEYARQMISMSAFWCTVNLVFFAAGWVAAGRNWLPKASNRWEAADLIGSTPMFFIIAAAALVGTFELRTTPTHRWVGVSAVSQNLLCSYVARQVTSFPLVFISGFSPKDQVLMSIHHALSIFAYLICICSMRLHWHCCFLACCEVTTIFLNAMMIMRAANKTGGTVYAANGVLLWLGFMIFRVVLFPVYFGIFWRDATYEYATTRGTVSMLEAYTALSVTLFLWVLSCMWAIKITKGMIKSLKSAKNKKKIA